MTEDSIYITDNNGKEIEMKILLTFDANNKKYVLVYEENNDTDVIPFVYDDNGNLYQVETEEEMSMIEEVLQAYEEKK